MIQRIKSKSYCFNGLHGTLFLQYNTGHPLIGKNIRFELGRVKLFTPTATLSVQLWSAPHLNAILEWDELFFAKLLAGFHFFEVGRGEELEPLLLVKDLQSQDGTLLLRARLSEDFIPDPFSELWNTFQRHHNQREETLSIIKGEISQLQGQAQQTINTLSQLQSNKEQEKTTLFRKLSALLQEKVTKLQSFGEVFDIDDQQIEEQSKSHEEI